jgi:ceramide glucosyltransferase
MVHIILRIVEVVAVLGCLSSSIYFLLCLGTAAIFLREQRARKKFHSTQPLPPASILKPLKGVDPEIYESFRSHCLQDAPEYEIIFGVDDANDPAIEAVRRLQVEFPDRTIQLVMCQKHLGTNVKVSNLVQMLAVARHEHLVINDSDIRVEGDYLRRVIAPLSDLKVGLVTCLYRGVAAITLGSRLEALGISTDFCAGVLAARALEGIHFGLGSTLAFRRADLEKIGGFSAILDYLADDYELGKRISALGLSVTLSNIVVETYLPAYTFRDFLVHQLRWARGIRDSRRGGYFGVALTFGIFWALLALVASLGAPWGWGLLADMLLLRFAEAIGVGRVALHDRQVLKDAWLVPLRDLLAVVVWIGGFFGNTVTWRGEKFRLENGKLVRSSP